MVNTRRGKANALVIGGSGFLGQHLVRALLRTGTYQACTSTLHLGCLPAEPDVGEAQHYPSLYMHALAGTGWTSSRAEFWSREPLRHHENPSAILRRLMETAGRACR